jgi:hypothetical protein
VNGDVVVDLRDRLVRRDVARLIELGGARAIAELLVELGQRGLVRTELETLLRRYITRLGRYDRRR